MNSPTSRAPASALRYALPFIGSAALLAILVQRIDASEIAARLDASTLSGLVPAFLAYGAVSLWLEALSLARATRAAGTNASLWTWARIKAASYPLNLVHYTIGVAGLTYLLQRRTELETARASAR